MNLPQGFRERMEALLGEEAEALFAALDTAPSRALRYDPDKVTAEELRAALGEGLGEPVPFCDTAFYLEQEGIGNHPLHLGGAVYVQDPGAMAPAAALPHRRFARVLDLCAAPGGKSLAVAATRLEPDGILVANEPSAPRRKALMQNVERMGERRILVSAFDGTSLPAHWEARFDLVLCDAPCSGEGMMRKHEEARATWSEEKIRECAALQRRLLEEAARVLKPGGLLLYSTCTWAPEENEEQIAAFLARHGDFSSVRPARRVAEAAGADPETAESLRFYPHRFRGEGQFLALLQRAPSEPDGRTEKRPAKKSTGKGKPHPDEAVLEQFLQETLTVRPRGELVRRGEFWYLSPGEFSQEEAVSPGVVIGSVQKGRVLPHHRFFTAFARDFIRQLHWDPQDPRIPAYLRGEEVAAEGRGFAVVFCGSCPLGGVKLSGGKGKNYYPKGLRLP